MIKRSNIEKDIQKRVRQREREKERALVCSELHQNRVQTFSVFSYHHFAQRQTNRIEIQRKIEENYKKQFTVNSAAHWCTTKWNSERACTFHVAKHKIYGSVYLVYFVSCLCDKSKIYIQGARACSLSICVFIYLLSVSKRVAEQRNGVRK